MSTTNRSPWGGITRLIAPHRVAAQRGKELPESFLLCSCCTASHPGRESSYEDSAEDSENVNPHAMDSFLANLPIHLPTRRSTNM